MTRPRKISAKNARRLAITKQWLAAPQPEASKQGILTLIQNMGCVQIDPLRAVERTQLLVLWSRLGNYDLPDFDALLWDDRLLFEYWAHAASVVLTEDYPLFQLHMREWLVGDQAWKKRTKKWLAENSELRRYMLGELRANGPLSSRDFKDHSQKSWESSGWTSGQNVSLMLNSLWRMGEIAISHRKGLTKYWDLAERLMPQISPEQELSWPEAVHHAAQRSLKALGVARQDHIEQHFTRERYPGLAGFLNQLQDEGQVIPVEIVDDSESWPGSWYLHTDDLALLEGIETGQWQPRTTLLSPFDNLICDRDRTELMFNFHFRIEIYLPAAKRQYGYYVMPILYGDQLIGRIDPKMDRKKKKLLVNAAYHEEGVDIDKTMTRAVSGAIEELATFLGANDVDYGRKAVQGWPGIG